jgi:hypothetical protein
MTFRNRIPVLLPKINWPRRQQHAGASRDIDHDREADARTARNTAVN